MHAAIVPAVAVSAKLGLQDCLVARAFTFRRTARGAKRNKQCKDIRHHAILSTGDPLQHKQNQRWESSTLRYMTGSTQGYGQTQQELACQTLITPFALRSFQQVCTRKRSTRTPPGCTQTRTRKQTAKPRSTCRFECIAPTCQTGRAAHAADGCAHDCCPPCPTRTLYTYKLAIAPPHIHLCHAPEAFTNPASETDSSYSASDAHQPPKHCYNCPVTTLGTSTDTSSADQSAAKPHIKHVELY